jgi:hypothetical protein
MRKNIFNHLRLNNDFADYTLLKYNIKNKLLIK